jgi:putative peptidoglycan lipid II flippase
MVNQTSRRLGSVIQRLERAIRRFVPPGALLIATLTFASYAMGLLRDRVFARTFGASSELDAYNAAFVLPELLLDVLVASGLTAPFVPIYARLFRDDRARADAFGRTVLTVATAVMAVTSAVLFVVAPATTPLIAPGFSGRQAEQYVDLFRLMCATPILFAASIALGELLIARRRFLWYALAPVLYNAGIVVGTVALADRLGIFAAAVGAVLGAVAHLAIRVVGIARTDIRIRPQLAVRTPAFFEFLRLMAPKMAAQPVEPLIFLFFTQLATRLGEGAVSSVSFARNFQSVPVVLIGAAFSLAVFPSLSAIAATGDRAAFSRILRNNLVAVVALTTIAAIGLIVVGELAIGILLGGGAFDAADIARTGALLAVFAISVPFDALAHPLARACYATRNTIWPVLGSLLALGVSVAGTSLLVPALGLLAIPAGFTLGAAAKAALLGVAIVPRVRGLRPAPPEPASTDDEHASGDAGPPRPGG